MPIKRWDDIQHLNSVYMSKIIILSLTFFALISCQSDRQHELMGSWSGEDNTGNKQTFVFRDDSTVLWIFSPATEADTFKLNYKFNKNTEPFELDLNGFNRGFLKNRSLFGILEFVDADTFRVDFEPGPTDTLPSLIRPKSFTDETVYYTKQVN